MHTDLQILSDALEMASHKRRIVQVLSKRIVSGLSEIELLKTKGLLSTVGGDSNIVKGLV